MAKIHRKIDKCFTNWNYKFQALQQKQVYYWKQSKAKYLQT